VSSVRASRAPALSSVLLLAVTLAGPAVPVGPRPEVARGSRSAAAARSGAETHPITFFDARAFAAARARVDGQPARPMRGARAIIVPHHWLAGDLILGGLRDAAAGARAAGRPITRVILLGPNHVQAGRADVITSDRSWNTPFGPVEVDRAAVERLVRGGIALSQPVVLSYEHSVAGLVPAVALQLPGARIVPLAVRRDLGPPRAAAAGEAVAALAREGTLIVASIDFSHGLVAAAARERNARTLALLRALDVRAMHRLAADHAEHLDGPGAAAVLVVAVRRLGATRFALRADATSADFGGPPSDVTSYLTGYYH